ncbi:hypothetical protein SAMD00019534_055810, partial [Acytostelium subglobosum LB1]|uniref:hypothetical protein n=1 Tax=Acytostelium subglobosum LB1 TaxID=1410327 RepID=UPI0006450E8E
PTSSNMYNLSQYGQSPTYTVNCFNTFLMVPSGPVTPVKQGCNSPLVYHEATNFDTDYNNGYYQNGTNCALPCPSPIFNDEQWDTLYTISSILTPIAFVLSTINLITYVAINRKFSRHTMGIIFYSLMVWIVSFSQLFYIPKGMSAFCPEPGRYARQFDTLCAATGFIFQYGVIAAAMWWVSIAFDLWLVIRSMNHITSYKIYYIFVINIIAVILAIVPLFYNQYGTSVQGLGCWIMDEKWQNGVFWIPLSIILSFGLLTIFLVCYEVYKGVSGKTRMIKMNIRTMIFVVLLFIEFLFCFIFHLYMQSNKDMYQNGIVNYIKCVMFSADNEACSALATLVPFKLYACVQFLMRFIGIETLVFYGVTSQSRRIWLKSWWFNNALADKLKLCAPSLFKLSSDGSGSNDNSRCSKSFPAGTNVVGGSDSGGSIRKMPTNIRLSTDDGEHHGQDNNMNNNNNNNTSSASLVDNNQFDIDISSTDSSSSVDLE